MIRTLIFDLSEVLIAGLVGIEKPLSKRLGIREALVLAAFGGDHLEDVLCGRITEATYLTQIVERQGWGISLDELQDVIRANLKRRVPGMGRVLNRLAAAYELVLLSDHATEWIEHVRRIHPFLKVFLAQFYSCELGQTKREPSTFRRVLREIDREPHECLFIDDYHKNIAIAASEGIPGILFESAEQLTRELTALGLWD